MRPGKIKPQSATADERAVDWQQKYEALSKQVEASLPQWQQLVQNLAAAQQFLRQTQQELISTQDIRDQAIGLAKTASDSLMAYERQLHAALVENGQLRARVAQLETAMSRVSTPSPSTPRPALTPGHASSPQILMPAAAAMPQLTPVYILPPTPLSRV